RRKVGVRDPIEVVRRHEDDSAAVGTHAVTNAADPIRGGIRPPDAAAAGGQVGGIATTKKSVLEGEFAAEILAVTNRTDRDRFDQMLAARDRGCIARYRDVLIRRPVDSIARRAEREQRNSSRAEQHEA